MNIALNILCESFRMMREKKRQTSFKLSALAIQLIKAESSATHESEADVVERAVMQYLASRPAYQQSLREAAESNPTLGPYFQAVVRGEVQKTKRYKIRRSKSE
jgi:hypothetical protein